MSNLDLLTAVTVFVLSVLVGIEVVSKVPATLHTPLMSGSNSVHGIVVIGAMLIAAESHTWLGHVLAFVAMAFGAMNVVGGYVVTDRMLEMFKAKPATEKKPTTEKQCDRHGQRLQRRPLHLSRRGRLLRDRPAPDEPSAHRPPRQHPLGRGDGRRDRRHLLAGGG
ncbi:NAD(P) transhydrogenase subunit alpha [Streptomyces sp. UG1]|uniref:NAD(P) transhydrogenase subunit alpha n=1 Tax=Streptomyces sp. UG1 TaxID=3417652 RepID=UPI003CF8DB9B